MPLPSVLNGAKQCQVLTKRTRLRCKNPCAFGSERACRLHGSHRSKNVLRGKNHPKYRNGERTKQADADRSQKSLMFKYLIDIGNHIKLFYKEIKVRGRPPTGYEEPNLSDAEQLTITINKVMFSKKS